MQDLEKDQLRVIDLLLDQEKHLDDIESRMTRIEARIFHLLGLFKRNE